MNVQAVSSTYKPLNRIPKIKVGDMVKIIRGNERFWSRVTKITKNGTVFAVVANELTSYRKKLGDPIRFKLTDIIDVQ